MNKSETFTQTASVITSQELLNHYQGHRGLTRRVIEAFPEEELFEYSIGKMRPFAAMVEELLGIAVPGLKQIAGGPIEALNEHFDHKNSKSTLLAMWDQASEDINTYWSQIPEERFHENIALFGQYDGTVWSSIFYCIDNEIHHRGQAYVYLRSLGIEPPFFYQR